MPLFTIELERALGFEEAVANFLFGLGKFLEINTEKAKDFINLFSADIPQVYLTKIDIALQEEKNLTADIIKSEGLYSYLSKKDPFKKGIDEIKESVTLVRIQGSEFTMGKMKQVTKFPSKIFTWARLK